MVETAKPNMTFRFEDVVGVKAIKTAKFPVTLGDVKDVRANIEAVIVKNDSPLQLNHKSMKTQEILLNFQNDYCRILGIYIKITKGNIWTLLSSID